MRFAQLIFFSLALHGIETYADVVAQFDFEGSSYASTDVEPLTIASSFLSQATGTNASGFGPIVTPTGASSLAASWAANAEASATNSFFEFTVSLAAATTDVSFDSLTFDALVADTLANTTAFDFDLYWSADSFASAIGSATGPSVSGGGAQNASSSLSFDLSALPSQSSAVTFRFDPVFAAGSSTNGGGAQRLGAVDNVVLNGTATAIPEPSSFLFLSIIGGLIVKMNRKNEQDTQCFDAQCFDAQCFDFLSPNSLGDFVRPHLRI